MKSTGCGSQPSTGSGAPVLDQETKDELREIAASLEEDIATAMQPRTMPTTDQHEMRIRALEAALTVALNAIINSK